MEVTKTMHSSFVIRFVIASAFVLSASSLNCSLPFDCNEHESCCNEVCVVDGDCLGYSCLGNTHCKPWETCCQGTCSEYCTPFKIDLVVASILGFFILSCVATLCFRFICRPRPYKPNSAKYGKAILLQEVVTAKTFTTRCVTQGDTPYQTEAVPGYPPQYVEYTQYKYEESSNYLPCAVKPWKSGVAYLQRDEFAWFKDLFDEQLIKVNELSEVQFVGVKHTTFLAKKKYQNIIQAFC